jgi:cobalt/nickel transport system permease protein
VCLLFLLAVHIADGVLDRPWLVGGAIVAAALALAGAWRMREEETSRVALLTAAFFVASQLHLPAGPTTVHLLLNGLVGVLLGWRAALAIPIGLLLQATLLGHGGLSALGVNCCVQVIPALLARYLFVALHRPAWLERRWFRDLLVGVSVWMWLVSLLFATLLLAADSPLAARLRSTATACAGWSPWPLPQGEDSFSWAVYVTFQPGIIFISILAVLGSIWAERRLENRPEFPLGLLIGQVTMLLTLALNSIALVYGGHESWATLAKLVFLANLPIAAIEGIVLGFTLGFLARVRPDMLMSPAPAGRSPPAAPPSGPVRR